MKKRLPEMVTFFKVLRIITYTKYLSIYSKIKLMENLKRIDEIGLNRLFNKHFVDGFIIITADRNEITDPAIKNKRFQELKNTIVNYGYGYVPVYGGYVETSTETGERVEVQERGLLVPNHKVGTVDKSYDEDKLKEIGIELANKFDQESFLYKPKGNDKKAYYIDRSGNVDMEFNDVTVNDLAQQFFTKLHNSKNPLKTDKRYTNLMEVYINKAPNSLREAYKRYGEQFFK